MELDDIATVKNDFRRANGAPLVVINGKNVRLSRPSSWGKILDDENALVNWKLNRAMDGVAGDPALQARLAAVKPDDRDAYKELRELAINAGRGDEAADIGTALHAMSERWEDPDDDFEPPEVYAKSLRAYSKALEEYGLVSELIEYHVVSTGWGAAGTADRLYRLTKPLMVPTGEILPEGTLVVGDLKTGKKLDFSLPGYCVQMAIYADGERYDVINDEFLDTPRINRDWGLLVHLPAGEEFCNMIWCDLGVGEHGARVVMLVKEWRRKWKNAEPYGAYDAMPPQNVADVADALDAMSVDDVEEYVEFISARLQAIKRADESQFRRLRKLWPEGMPVKKTDIATLDQAKTILAHIDKFEAEIGLTFPEDDPRVFTGTKSQKEKADNGNQ